MGKIPHLDYVQLAPNMSPSGPEGIATRPGVGSVATVLFLLSVGSILKEAISELLAFVCVCMHV